MNWSPPKERSVPQIVDRLVQLRPAEAWLLVVICTGAVALIDYLKGPELWLGPIYLLVMCLATWTQGWIAGKLVGIACMAVTLSINGFSLYPYADTNFLWNFGMRFFAISLVIAIISGMRRAYVREWWLARTDLLTGALNRQAFFELAPIAIGTTSWRLLVYADLDGLKKINDVHGHAAGDIGLQAYASTVRKIVRPGDIFARIGGDEFVIFMSVKDEAAARTVAARLHKAMNSISSGHATMTCSVGGLIVPPGEAPIDDLVRSADNLMYEAKLRGACLQLGSAFQGRRSATSRARTTPRMPTIDGLTRKKNAADRRTRLENLKSEFAPR